MKSHDRELIEKIAGCLLGIDVINLTDAEEEIVKLLEKDGIVCINELGEVAWPD